jgi:branched-chain amino acid aminotransferase
MVWGCIIFELVGYFRKCYDAVMEKKFDWKNLGFRLTPTKTMFIEKIQNGENWGVGEFVPFGPISISPAAGVLNYGQGLFEGLKAFYRPDGEVVLFRPQENAIRFRRGAERLCIPPVPVEYFIKIVKEIVRRNREYIPPFDAGSLYIRPCLWGTGEILGLGPAPEYCFSVFVSPVGSYFKDGKIEPIKLEVCDTFHRSAALGIGGTKFIGNYAPTLLPITDAKNRGFASCIFLDTVHHTYLEETGVANFFYVKDGKLFTPQLNSSILPGVIRDSVIQLAKEKLNLEVIEIPLPITAVLAADECFCTGTAAVVTPIGSITYQGRETVFGQFSPGPLTQQIYDELVQIQQGLTEDRYAWLVKVDND